MRRPLHLRTLRSLSLFAASLALGSCASLAEAANGQNGQAEIDRLAAEWSRPGAPGVSVAVSRDGVVLYERAFGTANLELNVPLKPESVFQVASVTKQFTAMCILLLQQRGRLSMHDEVRKHLPELPDYGTPLTIRHLLNHTSGLRDVHLLHQALAAPRDDIGDWNGILVRRLAAQRGLNFPPGSDFQYSNGGYALLATIVKKVSGQSLQDFAHENIFRPLGMSRTRFDDDPRRLVPDRVTGYARDGDTWRRAREEITRAGSVGNSGLLSTASDLLRWEHNLAHGTVGGKELTAAMGTPGVLTGGAALSYGLGLWITDDRGRRTVHHGGGAPGFTAQTIRYPDQGLAIVVLANSGGFDASGLAARISDACLGTTAPPSAASSAVGPGTRTASWTAEQLEARAGLYRESEGFRFVRLFVRDRRLLWSRGTGTHGGLEMIPLAEDRFVIPGVFPLLFEFLPERGDAPAFRASSAGQRSTTFERLPPVSSAGDRQYAGEYASSELDVTYTIAEEGGALHVHIPQRDEPIAIEPAGRDLFQTQRGDAFIFQRDGRGDIDGFVFSSNGVWSLHFDRVTR